MMVYWDTSAIFRYIISRKESEITGVTRNHTLAELFSALTGKGWLETMPGGIQRQRRMGLVLAARTIKDIRGRLNFIELTTDEIVSAIELARISGVQGARIHDLLHAKAAEKAGADELWTVDRNDFSGLGSTHIRQL